MIAELQSEPGRSNAKVLKLLEFEGLLSFIVLAFGYNNNIGACHRSMVVKLDLERLNEK